MQGRTGKQLALDLDYSFGKASIGVRHDDGDCRLEARALDDGLAVWRGTVHAWLLHDLVVAKVTCAPHRPHCRGRINMREGMALLRYYGQGRWSGRHEGEPRGVEAGDIELLGLTRDLMAATGFSEQVAIYLPYATLHYDPSIQGSYHRVRGGSAAGTLLRQAILALIDVAPLVQPDQARIVARGFAGLVAGLMLNGNHADAKAARDADQHRAMRRFVRENIGDPALGLGTLCDAFHASRATVYRAFCEVGGVDTYVGATRLKRAYHDLASTPKRRGAVQRVAERWGFPDASAFHRRFRHQFGVSPSDVLAIALQEPSRILEPSGEAGSATSRSVPSLTP